MRVTKSMSLVHESTHGIFLRAVISLVHESTHGIFLRAVVAIAQPSLPWHASMASRSKQAGSR